MTTSFNLELAGECQHAKNEKKRPQTRAKRPRPESRLGGGPMVSLPQTRARRPRPESGRPRGPLQEGPRREQSVRAPNAGMQKAPPARLRGRGCESRGLAQGEGGRTRAGADMPVRRDDRPAPSSPYASTFPRISISASTSAFVHTSGGRKRSVVGPVALMTAPASRARATMSCASG